VLNKLEWHLVSNCCSHISQVVYGNEKQVFTNQLQNSKTAKVSIEGLQYLDSQTNKSTLTCGWGFIKKKTMLVLKAVAILESEEISLNSNWV